MECKVKTGTSEEESGEEGVQMRSGEEQALVGGGGKLELQLGKKGRLSRAEREEERLTRRKNKAKPREREEPRFRKNQCSSL